MRVFVVARRDIGGCLYHLCHELRRRGLEVRLCVLEPDPAFPHDLGPVLDAGAEARTLLAEADWIHLVDLDATQTRVHGASVLEAVRAGAGLSVQFDRPGCLDPNGPEPAAVWTTRPDMAGVGFMPPFVPWWFGPWSPLTPGTRGRESVRRPLNVFASARVPLRRRPALEALVDRAEAAVLHVGRVETVVGRDHLQVLRRRRFSHLTLTEASVGLSLSALESLAQGVLTLATSPPASLEPYARLAGVPPVVAPERLEATLGGLQSRAEVRGREANYARRLLDPARWLDRCEALFVRPSLTRVA